MALVIDSVVLQRRILAALDFDRLRDLRRDRPDT